MWLLALLGSSPMVSEHWRPPLQAQVDPRGVWRTMETAHFRVHFAPMQEPLARRTAAFAEHAWTELSRTLAPPRGRVDVLLADNWDVSNGFATPFPGNRIVVYATPPFLSPELRHHDDWLQLVVSHELAHIFHLDRTRGVWSLGRRILGRHPALNPNAYLPAWIIEGIAVHYETAITGSGRMASTEFPMIARTAALSGGVPPTDAWSLATSRFPLGQHAYGYGAQLVSYAARQSDSMALRRFVDEVATHPLPWRLNRAARRAFGTTWHGAAHGMREALAQGAANALPAVIPSMAEVVRAPLTSWGVAPLRWRDDSTVVFAANTGRDVPGAYHLTMRTAKDSLQITATTVAVSRMARRNSLDAQSPMPNGGLVWGELDVEDPFLLRSALQWAHDDGVEQRLPNSTRLMQPDARGHDGAIVAVELHDGVQSLVRIDTAGNRVRVIQGTMDTSYTEPRWHPNGTQWVAVRALRDGTQQVVVLDTLGHRADVMYSARGVVSFPSVTPDGRTVVWVDDTDGALAVYGARLNTSDRTVRMLFRAATGVTAPAVSPSGGAMALMEYTINGWQPVIVRFAPHHMGSDEARAAEGDTPFMRAFNAAPVRTGERMPDVVPYAATSRAAAPDDSAARAASITRYSAWRTARPTWWMPIVGQGSDGGATVGATSSGVDIAQRHAWNASVLVQPRRGEVDAAASYRFSALPAVRAWQPLLDAGGVQGWDQFTVVDSARAPLGLLHRRTRTLSAAVTWARPRVRTSALLTTGVLWETRAFETSPSLLRARLDSSVLRDAHFPALFAAASWGNVMRAGRAISLEDGTAVGLSALRRWQTGTARASWRVLGSARGYKALDFPGFARHAVAVRASGGYTDRYAPSELSAGGTSGSTLALLPGVSVGDPQRLVPVRGFAPNAQRGTRALGAQLEYRVPLAMPSRGVGLAPLFLDRVSASVFADAGRAWCGRDVRDTPQARVLCAQSVGTAGWLASAGGELLLDLGLAWDTPYRVRAGVARQVAGGRGTGGYVTLGVGF